MVPWDVLQCVTEVFPDHTHFFIIISKRRVKISSQKFLNMPRCDLTLALGLYHLTNIYVTSNISNVQLTQNILGEISWMRYKILSRIKAQISVSSV